MGLFHRSTVEQPSQEHPFVNVIQNEGNNTGRGLIAWRDPRTNFNTHSKLFVRRGEEAIFENGASEWSVFPEATECELSTQNIAIIRSLREALSGGQSMFPCRVYFVSTEEFEIPWGTTDPIGYTCPLIGPGAQMKGNGEYTIRVIDSEAFVKKFLRDNDAYTIGDLKKKFDERIYQEVAGIISSVLEKQEIKSLEVSKKKKELAELCQPMIQTLFDKYEYGLMLVAFTISLKLDDDQRRMYEDEVRRQSLSATGEAEARNITAESKVQELNTMGQNYRTIKGMELLQTLAENPGAGGIASAGAGIGMGMAAGGVISDIAKTVFTSDQQRTQQPPQQHGYGNGGRFGVGESAPQTRMPNPMESLSTMKQMLDKGLISQDIYDKKVAEILSRL